MGTSGLGRSSVKGRKRVPSPAPRTNACVIGSIGLTIRHGRRNRLARQLVTVEKLRFVYSLLARGGSGRVHLRGRVAQWLVRNQKSQPIHLVPPGRADLYGARALSP